MGVFKNKVGRPSNALKRKRKIIIVSSVLVVVIIVFCMVFIPFEKSNKVQIAKTLNLSVEEKNKIIRQLNCNSGDTSVIKENEAYCKHTYKDCSKDGYTLTSDKTRCYKTTCEGGGTYNASTKKCTYSNPNYPCDKGYKLNKKLNMCEKEVESAYTNEKIGYKCPSGYNVYFTSNGGMPQCRKTTGATTSYKCLSGWTKVGDGPTSYCSTTVKKKVYADRLVTTAYSCNSGWTKAGDGPTSYCFKIESVKEKKYTSNIKSGFFTYKCPSGYNKTGSGRNTKCWKYVTKKKEKTSSTIKKNTYFCPNGYNKSGSGSSLKCWKYKNVQETKSTTKTPVCPTGYLVDMKNYNCYKIGNTPTSYVKSYSCKSGYYKANGTCYSRKKPSNQSVLTHTNVKNDYIASVSKTKVYNKIELLSPKKQLAIDTINKVWNEAKTKGYDKGYNYYGKFYIDYFNKLTGTTFGKTTPWCAIFMTYLQNQKVNNDKIANYVTINDAGVKAFLRYFLNKTNKTMFHYNSYCSNYKSNYLNDKGYIPKVGDYAIVGNLNASNSIYCGKNRNNLLDGNSSIDCHAHIGIVKSVDTKNKTVALLEGNTNEKDIDNNSHVEIISYDTSTTTDTKKGPSRNICKIVGFGSWY